MNAGTITNFGETESVNENVNEVQNQVENASEAQDQAAKVGKSSSGWKQVAIGGVAGIAMGVAGTLVASEGISAAGIDNNTPEVPQDGTSDASAATVPVATSVNDSMSFGSAFAAARAEVGAGGVFEWHGKLYNTYYVEEWNAMSPEQRDNFFEAVSNTSNATAASATAAGVTATETADTAESTVGTSYTDVPAATSVNDSMSFSEAFAAARSEVGAGGVFEWHGKTYNTFYAEEWDSMSPAQRNSFFAAAAGNEVAVHTTDEVADVQVVEDTADNEVRVIGVYEDTIGENDVYLGAMEVGDEGVLLVDIDKDGVFDFAVADENHDGVIEEGEIADISAANISVEDFAARAAMQDADDLLSSNDMPDYMNDADVSMC